MDFEKRIKKIMDNLSIKYDFFYLIKKNKTVSTVVFLGYIAFVIWVVKDIYTKHNMQGIIDNIFPFFVDIAIVFLITLIFLITGTIYNDEDGRIEETEVNKLIDKKVFLNHTLDMVSICFDKNKYYKQPLIIENLLKWVDFNKEDYFRTHYGALDISKISLTKLKKNTENITLYCQQTSFYDIAYTHYFPDYQLSQSSSTDSKSTYTLRELLKNNIDKKYDKVILQKNEFNLEMFDLLPNPVGITGIVTFHFDNEKYYLLQVRHKSEAAAKDKIQWSFADTIDTVPNFYKDKLDMKEFINDALHDEIFNNLKHDFSILKGCQADYKLIGFVLNPLYLYQPEFFASVIFDIQDEKYDSIKNELKESNKNFNQYLKDKNTKIGNLIAVSSLETIKKIIDNNNIKVRNLFEPGYEFINRIENLTTTSTEQ
jgi:hypothetical protein